MTVRVYYFEGSEHYYTLGANAAADGGPVRSCSIRAAITKGLFWNPDDRAQLESAIAERRALAEQLYEIDIHGSRVRRQPKVNGKLARRQRAKERRLVVS